MATTRKGLDLAAAVHGAGREEETAAAGRTEQPASRRGKKGVLIYLEPDMAKALKRLAVEQDTTIQALGVAAFTALLRRRG